MSKKDKLPEWAPQNAGEEFACRVMDGVEGGHDGLASCAGTSHTPVPAKYRRPSFTVEDYVEGVMKRDRAMLGRTITLVESNSHAHMELAQEVLGRLMPFTGNSMRIGISGVPGAGKSTFIEALGCNIIRRGHKVAVLAVDPSSSITGGSILGDKTRMERLSREMDCFIRPSPSGGTLGGVARKSRETMLVCEAAGYDVILIETIGVGQSEITVRSMVDFFLLLMVAGAGDELQGIKRGVTEIADGILVNKADGANKAFAKVARNEYERALQYLQPATKGWQTKAYTCSALTGEGIDEIWSVIEDFRKQTTGSGVFESRRRSQTLDWLHAMLNEHLHALFLKHPSVVKALPKIEKSVADGKMPPTAAANQLIRIFGGKK